MCGNTSSLLPFVSFFVMFLTKQKFPLFAKELLLSACNCIYTWIQVMHFFLSGFYYCFFLMWWYWLLEFSRHLLSWLFKVIIGSLVNVLEGFKVCKDNLPLSHLQFVDDTIVFYSGCERRLSACISLFNFLNENFRFLLKKIMQQWNSILVSLAFSVWISICLNFWVFF